MTKHKGIKINYFHQVAADILVGKVLRRVGGSRIGPIKSVTVHHHRTDNICCRILKFQFRFKSGGSWCILLDPGFVRDMIEEKRLPDWIADEINLHISTRCT